MRRILKCILLALLGIWPLLGAEALAESRRAKIEAAFLYNFLNYVTWPQAQSSKVTICVAEHDPVVPYLHYLQEKMQDERSLHVEELSNHHTVEGCSMVFLRESALLSITSLQKQAEEEHILLISDSEGFIDDGGMIELTQEGERMTIAINQDAMAKASLKASSRLLDLAKRVR